MGRWHDRRGDAGQASWNWAFEAWANDVGRGPRNLALARPMADPAKQQAAVARV
jgi:hypothetical protein